MLFLQKMSIQLPAPMFNSLYSKFRGSNVTGCCEYLHSHTFGVSIWPYKPERFLESFWTLVNDRMLEMLVLISVKESEVTGKINSVARGKDKRAQEEWFSLCHVIFIWVATHVLSMDSLTIESKGTIVNWGSLLKSFWFMASWQSNQLVHV